MRLKKILKIVLPIFAVALFGLHPANTMTVKAAKVEVIKTYTLSVNSDGSINNPGHFFSFDYDKIEGDKVKSIVVPSYITFKTEGRSTLSCDCYPGSNSSGAFNMQLLIDMDVVDKWTDMYAGKYILHNLGGEFCVTNITVTMKTEAYYDEYKEAVAKGLNWTLVGGDVVAECICKTKCTKEATNTECPVCKTDIEKCKPTEDTTSNTSNTDAAKAAEEQKKAEEAKKLEEQKKAQETNANQNANSATTADSGVATTTASDSNAAFTPEELALAQGQASQIIADAQIEAQSIIETANEQAETRLSEANEQASQILLDAGITVGQHKDTMPLGGMIALIILIIAVIGEGGVIAYTMLKDKIR